MTAVTRFPTGGQYVDALQNPRLCFRDPELQTARPQADSLGRPKAISGNFASVFSVTTAAGQRYAIKCFTRNIPDQEKRYRAVSDHLRRLPHRWKIGFDYQPAGIMVAGQTYPILRMEWVEAVGLIRWIEDHLGDRDALFTLAGHFADLTNDLARAGIAHGDLQHGNLLVASDGALKLVDYDGMYVPALAGMAATEHGHRHYQSPGRANAGFGPDLDRFSNWLIYFSLVAISADATLWHTLHEPGGEHLLLTDADFADISTSTRMAALMRHHVEDISQLATQVADLATRPLSALPNLVPLQEINVPAPSTQAPTQTGLPQWMSSHVQKASPPPPALVPLGDHHQLVRWTRITILGLWIATALTLMVVAATDMVAGATTLLGLALALLASRAFYAFLPEHKVRKTIADQHHQAHRQTALAAKTTAILEKERDRRQGDDARHAQADAQSMQALRQRQRHELDAFDRATTTQVSPLNALIVSVSAKQREEINEALALLQQQYVTTYLKRFVLRSGLITGIGEGTVASLRAHGITTPADFRDVVYTAGGYGQRSEVHIVLTSGRSVHVHGVGETRAVALREWRRAHLDRALRQPELPIALPQTMLQQIEARYATERQRVEAQREALQRDRTSHRTALTQKHTQEMKQLTDTHNRRVQSATVAAQDIIRRISEERTRHQALIRKEQDLLRELQAYRHVSYGRFMRRVLFGKVRA
ncbi:hypothetical protein [Nonomuraea jiangxiensis]|uniref:Protein kinase domain-containing protein n=1 Tax=Nonomuraea jiangxiensis TaxID=633440 RepID=A0A1G9RQX2_9ACTN|nr:hypothetical protein [Nonomuraea jiangxiensis]SDM25367.1 hypothetical protein SAMN05421869_13920 [Nonomuraea jiangxiensis]